MAAWWQPADTPGPCGWNAPDSSGNLAVIAVPDSCVPKNPMPGLRSDMAFRKQRVSHASNVGHLVFDFFGFFGGLVGPEGLEPPTKAL